MDLLKKFLKENKLDVEKVEKMLKEQHKDSDGNILLRQGDFAVSKMSVDSYAFTKSWILLLRPDLLTRQNCAGKMALIKSYISDKLPMHYSGTDAEMSRANNFILPELAKQFKLDVAEYYNVVFEDCEELKSDENYEKIGFAEIEKIIPNQRYLLTPSFKEQGEELIHFADILESTYELKATKILSQIETFLRLRHTEEKDIEKVKEEFIKQCIFNKYIEFTDEHNLNAGILVSKKDGKVRARLAPSYDLDFAAGVYNVSNGDVQPRTFLRKSDDGRFGLLSMLKQFKGEFERKYLKGIIKKININAAIENAEKYGNFTLSEKARNKYMKFFQEQQTDLENFYNQEYIKTNRKKAKTGEER